MPKANLPIPLGFYTSQSLPISSQRCINWIPTVMQGGALSPVALIHRPGIPLFTDTGLGACRGGILFDGVPYFVNGNSLVSISSTGVVTTHGTITGTVRVRMAVGVLLATKNLVIVVPGGDAFVWDTTTFTQITDPDFQPSSNVVYDNGFFFFTASNGQQIFQSNQNQPLLYDALDTGTADGSSDLIVTMVLDHGEISVLGSESVEVFTYVGGIGFTLRSVPGAFTEKGAHSKYGAIKFDSDHVFIGGGENEKSSIWSQSSSSEPVRISTDAIDHEIQKFTKEEVDEAFAMNYTEDGQVMALFSFNSDVIPGRTFVYNATSSRLAGKQVWFELQSGVTDAQWRVNAIVQAYGKLLVGDDVDGRIGYLDSNTYTEYDNAILNEATFQPFSEKGKRLFFGKLSAIFESGVGLTVGQGSDPVVRMSFSKNGGRTYSSEFSRSIGKIGEYQQIPSWSRQGNILFDRTVRFTITDPVPANLLMVTVDADIGTK